MTDFSSLKCAFVGETSKLWMSGRQRMETLRALGVTVTEFDSSRVCARSLLEAKIWPRLCRLPAAPRVIREWNARVLALAEQPPPDLAWFEWPRLLLPATLRELRRRWERTRFVCFQDDNPFGRRNEAVRWKLFKRCIPQFDTHFVKRSSDFAPFRQHGARTVILFTSGYYEPLFERPLVEAPPHDVAFIGTAIDHRVGFLEALVLEHGIPVRIYGAKAAKVHGGKWDRTRLARLRPELILPQVFEADYVGAIQSHRIVLGFVSSSNLDEYTMRTFEVPALGAFFLAERTPAHRGFFEEGREAEFFASPGECAQKIRHYLGAEAERAAIARAGALRCRTSGYGLRFRMAGALTELLQTLPWGSSALGN